MTSDLIPMIVDIIYFVVVSAMTIYNLFRGKNIQKNISLLTEMTTANNDTKIAEEVRKQVKEFVEELLKEKGNGSRN